MRNINQNLIDNALSKMFKINRDYIRQEIVRHSSPQAKSPIYQKNDIFNFGAIQMSGWDNSSGYMVAGTVSTSPIVGP